MTPQEREDRFKQRQIDRANRPHPIADFFGWLFTPVFSWWSFFGAIPKLVTLATYALIALVVLQFLKLFK